MAFAFWGAGLYGGMQGCPHDVSSSIDMSDYTDRNDQLRGDYERIRREIRDKRAKIRREKRKFRRQERSAKRYFSRHCEESGNTIELEFDKIDPVAGGVDCSTVDPNPSELNNCVCLNKETVLVAEGNTTVKSCQNFVRCLKHNLSAPVPEVCNKNNYFGVLFDCAPGSPNCSKSSYCLDAKKKVRDLLEHQEEIKVLEDQLTGLNEQRDGIREEQRSLRDDAEDDYREQVRDIAEFGATESGFCLDCTKQREFSWSRDGLGVGLNLLMGALGGYLGYKGFKDTVKKNVALGYPTPPYSAAQVMFPYVANGIYGAVSSSLGAGSLACGSSMAGSGGLSMLGTLGLSAMLNGGTTGSGAFGYPSGLFGNSGAAAALQLSLGTGLPPGLASLLGTGAPGGNLAALLGGANFPGANLAALLGGANFPGANLSALLGGANAPGGNLAALLGGANFPGANIFGSGALSLLGPGNQLSILGSGAADFSATSTAYTEYYQQQMEYMQRQMAMQQRYMEAQMERRASIQGLAQEIYKIQEQIQVIANSPIEYGVSVSGNVSLRGSASVSTGTSSTQTPASTDDSETWGSR